MSPSAISGDKKSVESSVVNIPVWRRLEAAKGIGGKRPDEKARKR
jgi:hypothetical protein